MLKTLDKKQIAPTMTASPAAAEVGHIVVLIPSPDADFVSITQKVWSLAQASGAPVRLIGLCNDTAQEPGIRRTLVTMASMLNDGRLPVSMEVLIGTDWLQMLAFHLEPHDIVVCWDEPSSASRTRSFSRLLQSRLEAPLYILSAPEPVRDSRIDIAKTAAVGLGFLAIIAAFLFLQIRLYQHAGQWTTTLEILSTACEFWLIWVWNRLFQ